MILTLLQSSALVVRGFVVVSLMGRRLSAATRHWILAVALFSSAVVPLLSRVIPSINITSVVAGFSPRPFPTRLETRAEARDYITDSTVSASTHGSAETRRFTALFLWPCGTFIA